MILRKMDEFDRMSIPEKTAVISRILMYPALTLIVLNRKDVGARVLREVGLGTLVMFVIIPFIPTLEDRFCFGIVTACVLLSTLVERFRRWREFRKGIPSHSYYLGTCSGRKTMLPFLRRGRFPEQVMEPVLSLAVGLLFVQFLPVTGMYFIVSGTCLFLTEQFVRLREDDEQRDIVDGLIKTGIQTETVERFEKPQQSASRPASTVLRTGLGDDVQANMKRRR